MDRTTPSSPPLSRAEILVGSGLHEGLQAGLAGPYVHDTLHPQSQPVSRYGTPLSQVHRPRGREGTPYQQTGSGHLGYHSHMYPHDTSPYGPIPDPYNTPATSPPTPARVADIINAQSLRATRRSSPRASVLGPKSSRVEKPPPKKKKKEKTKALENLPNLEIPLSEQETNPDVPVADIDAYVCRPIEERRAEVEKGKNPGKVKRPMNAFMLYRKAYQQRAKAWADQHNHQVVSRVCGMSWPKEHTPVRDQFKRWAEIERENHQKAHPDYKFTPSKPQKPKYREGGKFDDDGSDLEDYNWSRPGSNMRSRTRTPHPHDGLDGGDFGLGRGMYQVPPQYQMMHGVPIGHNRSAFEYSNPGKPMPAPYDHRVQDHYYETQVHNPPRSLHHSFTGIEDVVLRKTPSPNLAYQQHHHHQQQLQSPPRFDAGGGQYQQQPQHLSPPAQLQPALGLRMEEPRIDPALEGSLYGTDALTLTSMLAAAGSHGVPSAQLELGLDTEGHFTDSLAYETNLTGDHAGMYGASDEWCTEPLRGEFDGNGWTDPAAQKTEA